MLYVSEKAKDKIIAIKKSKNQGEDFFVRVSVQGGGCSGLTYKMDFDNESKPDDQEFEDKGIKLVTDLSSFLYLVDTTLENAEIDWYELCRQCLLRKYKDISKLKLDMKLKQKAVNYLAYNGFDYDQISFAINSEI